MAVDAELKLMTFNLFPDLPSCRRLGERLDLFAHAVASLQPNAVALQEVVHAAISGDLACTVEAKVNRACGSQAYGLDYVAADSAGEGEYRFEEGIATLTRADSGATGGPEFLKFRTQFRASATVGRQHYRLPDDRVATRIRLRPGVDFYATHLTDRNEAAADGAPIRLWQACELIEWIAARSDPGTPVLVAGDLNDLPESDTLAAFAGAGFIDLYGQAGAQPGYTNDRNDIDLESPRATHNQRIDYVLLRPPRSGKCKIVEARLFLDRPSQVGEGWLWASDHIGVMGTVRLG